jgi:hypothetical protein
LISSPLSEVWQFKFERCPQVQEISSVVLHMSCVGVGYLLCLFTGVLFVFLAPFHWGKVSDLPTGPLLSVCCVHCLFFSFVEPFDFWCCFVVCYLSYFRQWLITHLLLAFLPFQLFVTDNSCRD